MNTRGKYVDAFPSLIFIIEKDSLMKKIWRAHCIKFIFLYTQQGW